MELTKKSLLKHCREMNMYSTPELNDKLFLHQKAIGKIENLDEYTGLKVIWLQTNGIEIIQNLNHLTELRHLYLNENLIKNINGERELNLINLDTLNLERNYISKIQNDDLSNLENLNTLNLAHNRVSATKDLHGLVHCPSLCVLDLRNNNFTINNQFIDNILSKLPRLRVLYLICTNNKANQNSISDEMKNYRKTVISKCKTLKHLDDRPIFDDERRCCDAWFSGGIEAERLERQKIRNERDAKQQANHDAFRKLIEDAKKNRQSEADIHIDSDDSSDDDDDDDAKRGDNHQNKKHDDDTKSESEQI